MRRLEKVLWVNTVIMYMTGWSSTQIVDAGGSTITITLLGDPGGGKTSITRRVIGKGFNQNEQITVGADYSFHKIGTKHNLKLKICDIAGQASFRSVRKNYLVSSDAALLIFDLTNADSFANVKGWMREYISANKDKSNPSPILLVGNKVDLNNNRQVTLKSVQQFLTMAEDDKLYADHIIGYVETSAKTGDNIEETFDRLTTAVLHEKIANNN